MIDSVEHGLTFVLGHEIGHALARHQVERLGPLGLLNAVVLFLGTSSPLLGPVFSTTAWLPFNRDQEREADTIGQVGRHDTMCVGAWVVMLLLMLLLMMMMMIMMMVLMV